MQTNSNPWREIKQYAKEQKQQKPINMYVICRPKHVDPKQFRV